MQVAHVTRDSDTTFKVKGQLTGAWTYSDGFAYIVNIQLVNFHVSHSYSNQGALGAAGVRDGPQRLAYSGRGHSVSPRAQKTWT